ncbi:methyltransferase [Streptomyces sp. NBC_01618]|uniref:methyltransferase n=1 Tax=Streptomyces sp. NBC_01618 TaxID=2975900 RepID=UPI00386D48E1|nr:acetylserotonin O-methyltransferase [Streptomyces sp. NBC_01618]
MTSDVTAGRVPACEGAPVIGPPAAQAVAELGWGMWASAVVQAAAQLRLADAVDDQPASVGEIAKSVGADVSALTRLMRALVGFGIFRQAGPGRYEHTEASRALRSDASVSLTDIMLTGSDWGWAMWGKLAESVRSGNCAFQETYGKDLFTYFHEDDNASGAACLKGYAAQSRAMNPGVVRALDLSRAKTFCDVGGGHGSLVLSLLEGNPHIRGVLFDRKHAIDSVVPELREGPVSERVELVVGDCFESVPGADVHLIRQVLHMWDDDACHQVLSNCVAAGHPGGRVVLLEQLVADPPETPWDALMDLHMLLVMGGWERTEEEYGAMFERAGMEFAGVTPTGTPLRLIEGRIPG